MTTAKRNKAKMEINKQYRICVKYDDDSTEENDMGILIQIIKQDPNSLTILKFDNDGHIYNWYCPSRKIQKWIIKE